MAIFYTGRDRNWSMFEELRRQMDGLFEQYEPASQLSLSGNWPRTNIFDNGESLVVEAIVPGVNQDELDLMVHEDVLTISGERKLEELEGYTRHRTERRPFKFSRSFTLPTQVDFDKTHAMLRNGVLTVMLPKTPEAQPKRITVSAN